MIFPKLKKVGSSKEHTMYYTIDWKPLDKELLERINSNVSERFKKDLSLYINTIDIVHPKYKEDFYNQKYYFNEQMKNRYNKMRKTFLLLLELGDKDSLYAFKLTFADYVSKRDYGKLHRIVLKELILFRIDLQYGLSPLIDLGNEIQTELLEHKKYQSDHFIDISKESTRNNILRRYNIKKILL